MGYHARQLRGAELNYSATELEALAVISTVEHFAHYLFGELAVIQDAEQMSSVDGTEAATVELYYHIPSRT